MTSLTHTHRCTVTHEQPPSSVSGSSLIKLFKNLQEKDIKGGEEEEEEENIPTQKHTNVLTYSKSMNKRD